jgi:nucleoside-diphosphate-sugar epimerase
MRNIIITGAAGFIGANLLHRFKNSMDVVVGIDDFSMGRHYPSIVSRVDLRKDKELFQELVRYSIKATERSPIIIHCAAVSRVTNNQQDYVHNMETLQNVVMWSADIQPTMVIFCSSSATYGFAPWMHAPVHREEPMSMYGLAKLHGEEFLKWAVRQGYVDHAIALRLPNVYGPGQFGGESGAIINFLEQEFPEIRNPAHRRDYVFIDDIVNVFALATMLENPMKKEGFTWIPIGTRKEDECWATTDDLFHVCNQTRESPKTVRYGKELPGEMQDTVQAWKNILGWSPTVPLREGIKKTWDWVQAGKPAF